MGNAFGFIWFGFVSLLVCNRVESERALTWDKCNCRWDTWTAWSSCTESCGGGTQKRSRDVWSTDVPECTGFEKCATPESGWDYAACNTHCFPGGTFRSLDSLSGYCSCADGFHGTCCEEEITCGSPGSISHGSYLVDKYTYNGRVEYKCDTGYMFRDPTRSSVRICKYFHSVGYWTGNAPVCAYALHCNSYPCKNGATCTNLPDDYKCTCRHNWSGRNCDIDMQPPIVSNCPRDRTTYVNSMTSNQSWTEPVFQDPHGVNLVVSKNYPISSYTFPWGEHTIHYRAVKPSNGLSVECAFKMTIKPQPCPVLSPPKHGMVVCNGWNTDYATVCKVYCLEGFTLPPEFKHSLIFVCAANGVWRPQSFPKECIPTGTFVTDGLEEVPVFTDCSSSSAAVAKQFISDLWRSVFHQLCADFTSHCTVGKTLVKCG